MVKRGLIIAKIKPGAEEQVAEIFAESDRTELPKMTGVELVNEFRKTKFAENPVVFVSGVFKDKTYRFKPPAIGLQINAPEPVEIKTAEVKTAPETASNAAK